MSASRRKFSPATKQRGVVLFLALIVLVAMTLAGIAMVRSVDTGNLIAGNLSFQQGAVLEADLGLERAMTLLTGLASTTANVTPHYYAVMQDGATATPLGSNGAPSFINAMTRSGTWGTTDVYPGPTGFGPNANRVRVVIERMCNPIMPGNLSPTTAAEIAANCITVELSGEDTSSKKALEVKRLPIAADLYYRVTVRVDGPRNTTTLTQAILRF